MNDVTPANAMGSDMPPPSSYSHEPRLGFITSPAVPSKRPYSTLEHLDPDGINCICGSDHDSGFSVACDECSRWVHGDCFGIMPHDVPDEFKCWVCREKHDEAEVASSRKRSPGIERRPRKNGSARAMDGSKRRRRVSSASVGAHVLGTSLGLGQDEHIDIEDAEATYTPIAQNVIPQQDIRDKLRRYAQNWRGVSALDNIASKTSATKVLPIKTPSSSVRPPCYSLHTTSPVPAAHFLAPFTSTITSSAAYLADPLNGYPHLGAPKPFVHLIGPPLDLALDARQAGNETRWARNGCRPNAVLKPVLCPEERHRRADPETTLGFGVFALRDLAAGEEVVLGWEWDDGNAIHALPALVRNQDMFPPSQLTHLRHQMASILHSLSSTFTTCACGSSSQACAIKAMERFVDGDDLSKFKPSKSSPPAAPPTSSHSDFGPLIGTSRGFRARIREGGMNGAEMAVDVEADDERGVVPTKPKHKKRRPDVNDVATAFRQVNARINDDQLRRNTTRAKGKGKEAAANIAVRRTAIPSDDSGTEDEFPETHMPMRMRRLKNRREGSPEFPKTAHSRPISVPRRGTVIPEDPGGQPDSSGPLFKQHPPLRSNRPSSHSSPQNPYRPQTLPDPDPALLSARPTDAPSQSPSTSFAHLSIHSPVTLRESSTAPPSSIPSPKAPVSACRSPSPSRLTRLETPAAPALPAPPPPPPHESPPAPPILPRRSVSITDLIMATANVEKEAPPVMRAPSVPISSLIHSEDVSPSRRIFRSNTQKPPSAVAGLQILSDAAAGLLELRKENYRSASTSPSLVLEKDTERNTLPEIVKTLEAEPTPAEDDTMIVDPPIIIIPQVEDCADLGSEEPRSYTSLSEAAKNATLSPVHDTLAVDDNAMNLDLHTLDDNMPATELKARPPHDDPTEKSPNEPAISAPISPEQPALLLDGPPIPEVPLTGRSDDALNPLPDTVTSDRSPSPAHNDDVSVSSSLTSTPNLIAAEISPIQPGSVASTPLIKNDALVPTDEQTSASSAPDTVAGPEAATDSTDTTDLTEPSSNPPPVTPPSVRMNIDSPDAPKDSTTQTNVNTAPPPPTTPKVKLSLKDFALRKKRQREEREEVEAREAKEREEHGAKGREEHDVNATKASDGATMEREANKTEEGTDFHMEEQPGLTGLNQEQEMTGIDTQNVLSSTSQTGHDNSSLTMDIADDEGPPASFPAHPPASKPSPEIVSSSLEPQQLRAKMSSPSSGPQRDASGILGDGVKLKETLGEALNAHQSAASADGVKPTGVCSPRNVDTEMQDSTLGSSISSVEQKPSSNIPLDNPPPSRDQQPSDSESNRPRLLPLNGHDTNVDIPSSQAAKRSSMIPVKQDVPELPSSVRQIPTKPRMSSVSPTVDAPVAQNINVKSSLPTSPLNSSSPRPAPSKAPSGPSSYPRRASTSSVHEDGEIVVSSGPPTAPKSTYYRPHTPTPPTQPRSFSLNAGSPGGRYNGSGYGHSPPGYSQSGSAYARSYVPPSSRVPPSGPRALMRAPGRGPPRGPSADWDRDRDRDRTWYGSARPRGRGRP